MSDRSLRLILRRIALGLPLVAAPAVLIGCTRHCTPGPAMSTQHTATDPVRARLGSGPTLDPSTCRTVCFELDGLSSAMGDAGLSDGGTRPSGGVEWLGATVTCAYTPDGTNIDCNYQGAEVCSGGGSTCIIPPCAIAGRAPAGLIDRRPSHARGEIASWLAEAARLEAASVDAFEDLAVELALHEAPSSLARWARVSADDERRHARDVARLARRVGAAPAPVVRDTHGARSLLDIARDNAAEGCVREAFGAISAALQARRAESEAVRRSFGAIARDEARHALFSLSLDAWAKTRLSDRQRASVDDARREAHARFATQLATTEPTRDAQRAIGLLDATRAIDVLSLVA